MLARCDAFLTINNRQDLVASRTVLHQSSDGGGEGSSTINIALITSTLTNGNRNALQSTLQNHPFCNMTGTQLSLADVPSAKWSPEHLRRLGHADIVCFASASSVLSYLKNLDEHHLDVPEDTSDEDRKALPNTPEGATVMAACPNTNTGRECLNSGRWAPNHIYYPKSTQQAVELKAEPIGRVKGGCENSGEEELDEVEDINIRCWADSVVQAAGDVMERKFWGGGW